jgi:hypothetical protein
MKFKSALVTQISGSIGGMTGSRNGGGMYFRGRSIPTNPNTPFQQTVREAFGLLSNAWALLTQEQRDAWAVYAQNVPLPDRLGDQRLVSGMNHFVRSNAPRVAAEEPIISAAPVEFNIGPTPLLTIASITDNPAVNGTALPGTPGIAGKVLCYVSRPQQPTINYFRGPYQLFQVTSFAAPGTVAATINGDAPWALTAGQRVFVRIQISLADGRLSADAQGSAIVEAV